MGIHPLNVAYLYGAPGLTDKLTPESEKMPRSEGTQLPEQCLWAALTAIPVCRLVRQLVVQITVLAWVLQ